MNKNKSKASKSSLFLLELILSIFIFAIAGSVCVQLFVKAHLLSVETINRNNYMVWTQNIAEIFYSDTSLESLNTLLPATKEGESSYIISFDANWNTVEYNNPNTKYTATIVKSADDDYAYANIQFSSTSNTLYSLKVHKHLQKGEVNP